MSAARDPVRMSGLLLAVIAAVTFLGAPAGAQEIPDVISPLKMEPDLNGVNLATGRLSFAVPTLMAPAASRLTFDRINNAAPYMEGNINIASGGEYSTSAYSIHYGGDSAESFDCTEADCTSSALTGSKFVPFLAPNGATGTYMRAGSGEIYRFTSKSSNSTAGSIRRVRSYATSVTYPDGEVLTFGYDTALTSGVTLHRPRYIITNAGYYVGLTYGGDVYDPNDPVARTAWFTLKEAVMVRSSDGQVVRRFLYDANITDKGDGSGTKSYFYSDRSQIETSNLIHTLPDETSPTLTVSRRTNEDMVASVVRDGVTWNYAYSGITSSPYKFGVYHYNNLTVTGPNGYSMSYGMGSRTREYVNVVLSQTDALGRKTQFAYDGLRLNSITMPEGNKVTLTFDASGNITGRTQRSKSGTQTITETAFIDLTGCADLTFEVRCFRPSWYRDPRGLQTDFVYNSRGQVIEMTEPANASGVRRKTIITYTPSGISRKPAASAPAFSLHLSSQIRPENAPYSTNFVNLRDGQQLPA